MRPLDRELQLNVDSCVRIHLVPSDDSVSIALRQRVPIRQPSLLFVANASVEVFMARGRASEPFDPLGQRVVHKLRH
jgi:hypothetical protein